MLFLKHGAVIGIVALRSQYISIPQSGAVPLISAVLSKIFDLKL